MEILSIKKQHWIDDLGPEILARGDYLIKVRFLAPEQYQNVTVDIPVVRLSDLTLDGLPLQPGDIVNFNTENSMLTGAAKPYMFERFTNIKLRKKSAGNSE